MSKLFKILIPLIGGFSKDDFSENVGFIDAYTIDEDKPYYGKQLFLAYDNNVRNNKSIDLSRRFDLHPYITKSYCKICNGIPYYIYMFRIPPTLKDIVTKIFTLDVNRKLEILQFWGLDDDINNALLKDNVFCESNDISVPLEDYNTKSTLNVITEKGSSI